MSNTFTVEEFLSISNTLDEKKLELEKFLQCVKGNEQRLHALCNLKTIYYRDDNPIDWISKTKEEHDSVEMLTEKMIKRILSGEQEVNDKKGQWNNGCFGSRWYDDRNTYTECRVAFYSRKTEKDWKHDKPYLLGFTFSNRCALRCGNPTCDNKGHGYKKCSLCMVRRYCSSECQRAHWKEHKGNECKEFQEMDDEEEDFIEMVCM
jgi:hypothetical protein